MKNGRTLVLGSILSVFVLMPAGATAQEPVASPSPSIAAAQSDTSPGTMSESAPSAATSAQGSASSEAASAGDFNIISNIEFGVRGLGIDGNREKYYSDLNYRAGFRIFDTSLLLRAKENRSTPFDTLLVVSNGFDADPHGMFRANVEKTRWYKFDAHFRRNNYFNFISCCNLAQSRAPGPTAGFAPHTARVKHKIGDFDLRLLPQNRSIRFNLGYSMDRYRGPGGSSLSFARDDFALAFDPWRSRSDEFRGGVEGRVANLDLAFTQGYRYYRDDSTLTSGFNLGSVPPPANISEITSYLRSQPMRGRAWYSRMSAHTQIEKRFDITARYIFTKSRSRFAVIEDATGRGNLENQNVFIDLNRVLASSDSIERPSHLFDLGMTFNVTDKLRISNTFRVNQFRVEGSLDYTEIRQLRRISGSPALPNPIVLTLNPFRELDLRRWQNNLELDYDFGPRFSFFVGHRYIDRRLEELARQRVYPLSGTTPTGNLAEARAFSSEHLAENSTNGFFGGFKARPVKSWNIWFDANRGQSDNAFTRVDNYDTVSFRLRNRVAIRRGLNFSASVITRDNNNPGVTDEALLGIPEFDVDISSRVFTTSLDWTSNEKIYFSGGYTYQHLTSDIGIIFNPGATGTAGLGRSFYYLRDHYFFFNTSVRPHRRLGLYASYNGHKDNGQGERETNDAAGLFIRSIPLRFQSPEVRAVFKINDRLDFTAGYQYYDYKEDLQNRFPDLFVNQNYRAHLPYASLRIYFGGNGNR